MTTKTAKAKYFPEHDFAGEKWRVIVYPADSRSVDLGVHDTYLKAERAALNWMYANGYARLYGTKE